MMIGPKLVGTMLREVDVCEYSREAVRAAKGPKISAAAGRINPAARNKPVVEGRESAADPLGLSAVLPPAGTTENIQFAMW